MRDSNAKQTQQLPFESKNTLRVSVSTALVSLGGSLFTRQPRLLGASLAGTLQAVKTYSAQAVDATARLLATLSVPLHASIRLASTYLTARLLPGQTHPPIFTSRRPAYLLGTVLVSSFSY